MTPVELGLLVVGATAAVVDWAAVAAGGARALPVERVAKPAVLVALIAFVIARTAGAGPDAARGLLLTGLLASLAGDLLLLPPGRFVPGLVAFLVAHVAYLLGFVAGGGLLAGWMLAGSAVAVVVLLTAGRVLIRAAGLAGLAIPVSGYMAALTLMAVAATGTGEAAAIAGGWLFVASDTMLGWGRFREPGPGLPRGGGRALGVAVMVSYHLAQGLIVLALVR